MDSETFPIQNQEFRIVAEASPEAFTTNAAVAAGIERRWRIGLQHTVDSVMADAGLQGRLAEAFPASTAEQIAEAVAKIPNVSVKSRPPRYHQTRPDLERGRARTRANRDIQVMEAGQMVHAALDTDAAELIESLGQQTEVNPNRQIITPCGISYYPRTVFRWGDSHIPLEGGILQVTFLTMGVQPHRDVAPRLMPLAGARNFTLWSEEAIEELEAYEHDMVKKAQRADRLTRARLRLPILTGFGLGKKGPPGPPLQIGH